MRRYTRSSPVLARTLSARVEGFERTLPVYYQGPPVHTRAFLPGIH